MTSTQPLPQCTPALGFPVALGVAEYTTIDPAPDSGCVVFPANPSLIDSAEYLVVPQSAAPVPGSQGSFRLAGEMLPAPAPPRAAAAATPVALTFHDMLRRLEAERRPTPAAVAPAIEDVAPAAFAEKPQVGEVRQFSVCATLTCSRFDRITATARAVGAHLAIFVDNAAPAGLDSAQLDTLKTLFDTRLYAVDTAAFGRESDVNGDSVVIVLMTPVVNKLVDAQRCEDEGFVAGFFYGADIDPSLAGNPNYNGAEIFYSLVADPAGTLSCEHTVVQVMRLVPITFVHEFQHMISYNQHVIERDGPAEVLWLNEALSHFAEELAGRTFLAEGNNTEFSRYLLGNLFNAYLYLLEPGGHSLLATEGIGSLEERGAQWLYLRYLVDRYGDQLPGDLVQTSLTGATNVATQTGVAFDQSVTRWILAAWVDDLPPPFAAPPELHYDLWDFRTTYASLYAQCQSQAGCDAFTVPFPLQPTAGRGDLVALTGTLRAGSGVYHRILQGPGDPGFTIQFSTGGGGALPANLVPRLNVIRIR